MKRLCSCILLCAAILILAFYLTHASRGKPVDVRPGETKALLKGRTDSSEIVAEEANRRREKINSAHSEARLPEAERLRAVPEVVALKKSLRVQVLDALGNPAIGVEVAYRLQISNAVDSGDDLERALTVAPDGIVELNIEEEARAVFLLEGMRQPFERVVSCRGPFLSPPEKRITKEQLGDLILLELPATAGLDVEVLGPDGERILEGAHVAVSWYFDKQGRRGGYRALPVIQGRASLGHLSCGLWISIAGSVRNSFYRSVEIESQVPWGQGERVSATLNFEAEHPVLSGRLLRLDGTPLVDTSFALDLYYNGPAKPSKRTFEWGASTHRTAADGSFAIPWSAASWTRAGASGVRELRFAERPPRTGPKPGWVPQYTQIQAPGFQSNKRRYELGDVSLGPVPILVAGQVVDREGKPMSGVYLRIQYPLAEGDRTHWYNYSGNAGREGVDDAGRFEVRSFLPFDQLQISATRNSGGSTDVRDIRAGAADVRLVFQEPEKERFTGSCTGEVLSDEGIPYAGLEVRMLAGIQKPWNGGNTSMIFQGKYQFQGLQPGTFAIQIVTRGHGYGGPEFILFEEQGIVIRAGEEFELAPIDLRSRMRLFEFVILEESGERSNDVACIVSTNLQDSRQVWIRDGRLVFVAPVEVDSVQLKVGHTEPIALSWSPEVQTITRY